MTFEEYMESKIPGYKTLVPEEVISTIKRDFETKELYRKSRESATNMALNHNKADIDYTTTIEKNLANENRYQMIIENEIEQVKQQLGIGALNDKNTGSHK